MPKIIMVSRQILVIDTNIIIDFHQGGILECVFKLPFSLITPDVIVDELEEPDGDYVKGLGLKEKRLPGSQVTQVITLSQTYRKPSVNDLFALVLAENLSTILLTGDKSLRDVALIKKVKVRGTLWLLDQLVSMQTITPEKAQKALKRMLDSGSRLPRNECQKRIKEWGNISKYYKK